MDRELKLKPNNKEVDDYFKLLQKLRKEIKELNALKIEFETDDSEINKTINKVNTLKKDIKEVEDEGNIVLKDFYKQNEELDKTINNIKTLTGLDISKEKEEKQLLKQINQIKTLEEHIKNLREVELLKSTDTGAVFEDILVSEEKLKKLKNLRKIMGEYFDFKPIVNKTEAELSLLGIQFNTTKKILNDLENELGKKSLGIVSNQEERKELDTIKEQTNLIVEANKEIKNKKEEILKLTKEILTQEQDNNYIEVMRNNVNKLIEDLEKVSKIKVETDHDTLKETDNFNTYTILRSYSKGLQGFEEGLLKSFSSLKATLTFIKGVTKDLMIELVNGIKPYVELIKESFTLIGQGFTQISNYIKKPIQQISKSLNKLNKKIIGTLRIFGVDISKHGLIRSMKDSVKVVQEYEKAVQGLNSTLSNLGLGREKAQQIIQDFTSDGLVTDTSALKSYRNLLLTGFDESQAQDLLTAFKDVAAFNRKENMSLEKAIETGVEGLKTDRAFKMKSIGLMKSNKQYYEEYAQSIGKTKDELTEAEKIQAKYQGVLKETSKNIGDATILSNTYEGSITRLKNSMERFKITIGNVGTWLAEPIFQNLARDVKTLDDVITVTIDNINNKLRSLGLVEIGTKTSPYSKMTIQQIDAEIEALEELENQRKSTSNSLTSLDKINIVDLGGSPETDYTSEIEDLKEIRRLKEEALKADEGKKTWLDYLLEKYKVFISQFNLEPLKQTFNNLKESLGLDRIGDSLRWINEVVVKPFLRWVLEDALPAILILTISIIEFLKVAIPVFKPYIELLGQILVLFILITAKVVDFATKLLKIPFVGTVLGWVLVVLTLYKAFTVVGGALVSIFTGIVGIGKVLISGLSVIGSILGGVFKIFFNGGKFVFSWLKTLLTTFFPAMKTALIGGIGKITAMLSPLTIKLITIGLIIGGIILAVKALQKLYNKFKDRKNKKKEPEVEEKDEKQSLVEKSKKLIKDQTDKMKIDLGIDIKDKEFDEIDKEVEKINQDLSLDITTSKDLELEPQTLEIDNVKIDKSVYDEIGKMDNIPIKPPKYSGLEQPITSKNDYIYNTETLQAQQDRFIDRIEAAIFKQNEVLRQLSIDNKIDLQVDLDGERIYRNMKRIENTKGKNLLFDRR